MTEHSESFHKPSALSATEAREALAAVRAVQARTRRALSLAGGGEILMIWGAVWMLGYLGSHLYPPPTAGLIWLILDIVGIAATVFVAVRANPRWRDPMGPRVGVLWMTLLAFGALWIWAAEPASDAALGFLLSTFAMFGYVVMGLWLDLAFLVVGLAVTAIATVGYVWFVADFNLWMALLGGGTLLGSGLYIRRRWR